MIRATIPRRQTKEIGRKKVLRAVAREIGDFMRENQRPLQQI
jgi:hypothetical protein